MRRTIAAMHERGGLDARSAARCALALELAQVITAKRATGRMSTIGNDARVLVELLDKLAPADEASDVDEELRKTMADWATTVAELAGVPRVDVPR